MTEIIDTDNGERPAKRIRLDPAMLYRNYHLIPTEVINRIITYQDYHLIPIDVICHIIIPMLDIKSLRAFLFVNKACHEKAQQLVPEYRSHGIFRSMIQDFHDQMEYQIAYNDAYSKRIPYKGKRPSSILHDMMGKFYYIPDDDGCSQFENAVKNYDALSCRLYMPKKGHNPNKTHLIPANVLLRIQPKLNNFTICRWISDFQELCYYSSCSEFIKNICDVGFDHLLDWIPIRRYVTKEHKEYKYQDDFNKPWTCTTHVPDEYKDYRYFMSDINLLKWTVVLVFVCCRKDSPFYGRLAFAYEAVLPRQNDTRRLIYFCMPDEKVVTLAEFDDTKISEILGQLYLEHLIEKHGQ